MKTTNLLILNRIGKLPADKFVHVVPFGEYPVHVDGQKFVQILDEAAITAMANRFAAEPSGELLADYEHFSYDEDKQSTASGWIKNVEVRSDGLWARVEWTPEAETALLNKAYKYISPVWLPSECENLGGNRLRPLRLDSVGLTNKPNLKGMQPLSNRGGADKLSTSHQPKERKMKELLKKLNLSADASEDSAVDAVDALLNRATEADALRNRAEAAEQALEAIKATQLEADAEAFCDLHKDVISNRDDVKKQFIANRSGTEALFASLKKQAAPEPSSLKNRATKQPDTSVQVDQKEVRRASAIRNRANEIMDKQKCSWSVAFSRAQAESVTD